MTDPLVQSGDLVYQGSFKLPNIGSTDAEGFPYGGSALSFDPIRQSLFLVGFELAHKVAEVSIPALGGVATLLQPLSDVTEGALPSVNPGDPNGSRIGGLLPWGAKLIVSAYAYYDANGTQVLSHFVSGQPLATTGDLSGPFQVGSAPVKAGYVSGYMGVVPPAWRAALGGPAFTGNSALAIVTRTSQGPAVCTFDPDNIGVKVPCPATPLVYYDPLHPLGQYSMANPYYNGSTEIRGVVMPEGSRSVLFFGRHGMTFCYGAGTTNQALDQQPVPNEPGVHYCYDPEDQSKGTHGYPYKDYVWAYDANDLAAVVAGTLKPWEPKPYATWDITFPTKGAGTHINGAAYDPATNRLFLSQAKADGDKPLIHVFMVGSGTVVTPPPPPPPDPIPVPPPPPPPPPVVTVQSATLVPRIWTLTVTDVPPDSTGGWSVQFYRAPGIVLGGIDASGPYTRSAIVSAGTYLVTAVWTKAGQPTVTRSPKTMVCPTP
jgi:hypothetical protein